MYNTAPKGDETRRDETTTATPPLQEFCHPHTPLRRAPNDATPQTAPTPRSRTRGLEAPTKLPPPDGHPSQVY